MDAPKVRQNKPSGVETPHKRKKQGFPLRHQLTQSLKRKYSASVLTCYCGRSYGPNWVPAGVFLLPPRRWFTNLEKAGKAEGRGQDHQSPRKSLALFAHMWECVSQEGAGCHIACVHITSGLTFMKKMISQYSINAPCSEVLYVMKLCMCMYQQVTVRWGRLERHRQGCYYSHYSFLQEGKSPQRKG